MVRRQYEIEDERKMRRWGYVCLFIATLIVLGIAYVAVHFDAILGVILFVLFGYGLNYFAVSASRLDAENKAEQASAQHRSLGLVRGGHHVK